MGKKHRTFGDRDDATSDISVGCSNDDDPGIKTPIISSSSAIDFISRRRLQTINDPSFCNNVTNFFCWMSCLEIPNHGQSQGYLNEGNSLYCLDPAVLAASGNKVSEAVKPCDGSFHNDKCTGSWQPTVPGIIAADVVAKNNDNINLAKKDEPYCYGGRRCSWMAFIGQIPFVLFTYFLNWYYRPAVIWRVPVSLRWLWP